MKKFRVIMITVVIVALLFLLQGVGAVDQNTVEQVNIHNNEFYSTLTDSIKTYNDILDGLNSEAYTISSTDSKNYDDYYGGAYVDEETGELIVLVTELTPDATSKISTYAEGSENIRYQLCDVSYSQIEEAIEAITEHMSELYDRGVEVVIVRDDILNGRVVVGVVDLDHEKETMIRTIADYDFLVFEDSERGTPEAAYGAGSQIDSIWEDNVYGSRDCMSTIGFAATMNGKKGFVMAGHAGWAIGQKVQSGNTVLGTVTKTGIPEYVSRSTADASFVQTADGISLSNTLNSIKISGVATNKLPLNTPIVLNGSQTKGTSGKICSINTSFSFVRSDSRLIFMSECMAGDYRSVSGDSGGPVMAIGAQGSNTYYRLIGTHSGFFNGYSTFVPYSNIVNALGVSCILG